MKRTEMWWRSLGGVLTVAACTGAWAASPNIPLPEMTVPKAIRPPVIDGKMDAGEWEGAAACTAFVRAFEGDLAKVQTVAWIMYDDHFLYVAMKNYRGERLDLLQKKGRRVDDDNIVFDPSNEVWISPPGLPATTYQTLFNAYPAVLDAKMIPSLGYTSRAWSGKWEIASTEGKDSWIVEAKAPLSSFGFDHVSDGDTWGALFTTDVFQDGEGFRAWAPGGGFSDIARHGKIRFRSETPAFQLLDVETIFSGKPTFPMAIVGPRIGHADVAVSVRFGADVQSAAGDLVLNKTVSVGAGQRQQFSLGADLADCKLPSKPFTVDAKTQEKRDCKYGFCEVSAKAGDGSVLYHQVFPFVINGFVRSAPATIKVSPYETAFGLEGFYAPLSKKLLVKIDRYYLPQREMAAAGKARLVEPSTGKVVAERPIGAFRQDYSEFPIDLSDLQVPIETEDDWTKAQASPENAENQQIAKDNQKLKAQGKPLIPLKELPGTKPAMYDLQVVLSDAQGKQVASASTPVGLMGYQFAWLPNDVGISDKVIAPWTPMKLAAGNVPVVSMWNKQYHINGLGLADRIVNSGSPQLSGPMKLVAVVDGKEVEIAADAAAPKMTTEAAIDLAGTTRGGSPLSINTQTHVEFDGFVLNTMTIQPTQASIDRLSLVVTMPEQEAPCFVTTSGFWASYHGWTPAKWDSRESALTSMVGNLVPYVFLTDSDRGFCWFADNEKGWRLDPAAATQELTRANGLVTLRVNFITRPGRIDQPMTVRYGWMVTPQKPQPKGWRGYHILNNKEYPQATCMYWNDADWAVLWPYYSSPFPRSYEKSKSMIANSANRGVVGCVGNIAHAIARYQDYRGRPFASLVADWGNTPGKRDNGDVARSRGPNDFQLWHFDRWVKLSGLNGLYFDENYLGEDWNYLTGGAYLLPDERVQPGYDYLALREYDKRLRYMFAANGKAQPNLWLHTTSGQAVYAWMPDLAMEGENVEPVGGDNDYIEALPASRIRSIGMGRNLGAAPTIMCQADRHWSATEGPFLVHQFLGWVLSHDVLPEQVPLWMTLASELELWHDDVEFLPYWKKGLGLESASAAINVSAHVRPGHAVLWIVNTSRHDQKAEVKLDLSRLGLDAGRKVIAFDAETGESYALSDGRLMLDVPKRMWRAVRLVQPVLLHDQQTFVAHFDGGELCADEAFGARYPKSAQVIAAREEGKEGKGASLNDAVSFGTRQHVTQEQGAVSFQFKPSGNGGTLLTIGGVRLMLSKNKLSVIAPGATPAAGKDGKPVAPTAVTLATTEVDAAADAKWHAVTLRWSGTDVQVTWDGDRVITSVMAAPMPIVPMGRGLDIRDARRRIEPSSITLGPVKGAVIDDLVMERR